MFLGNSKRPKKMAEEKKIGNICASTGEEYMFTEEVKADSAKNSETPQQIHDLHASKTTKISTRQTRNSNKLEPKAKEQYSGNDYASKGKACTSAIEAKTSEIPKEILDVDSINRSTEVGGKRKRGRGRPKLSEKPIGERSMGVIFAMKDSCVGDDTKSSTDIEFSKSVNADDIPKPQIGYYQPCEELVVAQFPGTKKKPRSGACRQNSVLSKTANTPLPEDQTDETNNQPKNSVSDGHEELSQTVETESQLQGTKRDNIFQVAQRRAFSKAKDPAPEVSATQLRGSFEKLTEGLNKSTKLEKPFLFDLNIVQNIEDNKDPMAEIISLDSENKCSNLPGERVVQGQEGFVGDKYGGGEGASENQTISPMGALEAFSLSPDKQDEQLFVDGNKSFGVARKYFLDVIEIARKNKKIAADALKDKDEALTLLKKANEHQEMEKQEVARLSSALSMVQEELSFNKGVVDVERKVWREQLLAKEVELKNALNSLEKVEKETLARFKDSPEFEEIIVEKAGMYHEDGFNDCLRFVGTGNIVDDKIHTIERYRAIELEKAQKEREKAKAEAKLQYPVKKKVNIKSQLGGIQ